MRALAECRSHRTDRFTHGAHRVCAVYEQWRKRDHCSIRLLDPRVRAWEGQVGQPEPDRLGFVSGPLGQQPTLGEDDCHIRGKATVVRRDDTVSLSEQTAAALGQAWDLRHILVCRATPGTYSRRTGRKSECVQYEDFRPARRWDALEAARAALRADEGIRCPGSRYDMAGLLAGGHGYRTAASGAVWPDRMRSPSGYILETAPGDEEPVGNGGTAMAECMR